MAQLHITTVPTLAAIGERCLDEITADGHVFATTAWYRLLDRLDLSAIVGGSVELRYVVATAKATPIAVCPLLRVQGHGAYFAYSLRRYYFEHWIDDAVRLNPEKSGEFARLFRAVTGFRKLLEWTGSVLEDCLIATCPMTYRALIPVAPSSSVAREEVYRAIIAELQRLARTERRILCILGVEGETGPLQKALAEMHFSPTFLFYDNQIRLEQCASFADYLSSFRRTTRRAFLRDMRRTQDAGVQFHTTNDLATNAQSFTELYEQTYSQYGESYFRHSPDFWKSLGACMPGAVEAILAVHDDRLIGFTILLKSARRGEAWTYRIGRLRSENADVPYYFGLSYYSPLQRAIELGYRRLWLGPASYEAKSVRGAVQVPLYNYLWFPRRLDRWLLAPYMRLFGKITRDEIVASLRRPVHAA